jgi:hypothetical protein
VQENYPIAALAAEAILLDSAAANFGVAAIHAKKPTQLSLRRSG